MDSLLHDHPVADGMGKLTFLSAILMNIWNLVSHVDINQVLVVLTSLVGLIYMTYKLRIVRLEWKEKKAKRDRDGR